MNARLPVAVTAATRNDHAKAQATGKTAPPAGWDEIDPKTGAPVGIDKGWAYKPGASRAEELQQLQQFASEKAAKLPGQISADFAADTAKVGAGGMKGL